MNMVKLSFIVPVYNVAPYLHKCVDSLLAQDYSDYEIILVDDGSTDNSPQICDEYVSRVKSGELKVKSICVIHQANAGLSAARNAGLKAAKGEYVCFVDSDDYWEENVLGGLMKKAEREKLDVLRFNYQNVQLVEGKYEVFLPNKYPHQVDTQIGLVDGETYLNERMGYACYAVMFIMRREMVPYFTEGIHFEDVDWLPRMMLRAKRVNSTTTIVYNYLVRQGSITKVQGDRTKIRKNLEDSILIIDRYRQYREQHPDCTWLYNMQSSMAAGVLTTVAREFYSERREYIARLREMKVFPLRIADQGKTFKRRAILINLSPRLAVELLHLKNRK